MENLFYGKYRKVFLAVYILLLVLWLGFIFYNSASNGEKSTQQSDRVVKILLSLLRRFDSEAMVDVSVVRTTAHFAEFFVLGFLYIVGSFFIKASRLSLFLHSLSLSLFTAFADETVQLYSVGRGAEVTDIWTDFLGAVTAHILAFAIYYTYKHYKTASK